MDIVYTYSNEGVSEAEYKTINKEASSALEARINYIIKIAEAWKSSVGVSTTKGNSVVIGGERYDTANQDEEIELTIKINAEDGALEGIYYNADDENSLTTIDNLTKNADGSYVFKMLRGGGMLLGLKVHTHAPGSAVKENITATGYDSVVYCTGCGAELSRQHVDIIPEPVVRLMQQSLVYSLASLDTMVNGVKAEDQQSMAEVAVIVGNYLDNEKAAVGFEGVEQVLNSSEMERFERLNIKERFLILLIALGFDEQLENIWNEMGEEAKALAIDIRKRMETLSNAEIDTLRQAFEPRTVSIDGQDYESIGIVLIVNRNGEQEFDHYIFYNDNSVWRLYQIEIGRWS